MKKKHAFLWFLFGLGSQLQLFGTSLCFTELFVYGAVFFLVGSEWPYMKRNGVTTFFWFSICLLINGALSCVYNHTPFAGTLRGMAVLCLLPCAIVVCHWMLRLDMANFKWSIIGGGISGFLSTFFFQKAVDVSMSAGGVRDGSTAGAIMNGPLWLVGKVGSLFITWPKGWYLQFPTWLSAGLPVGLAAFALFTSISGRGTAVRSLCSAVLIFLGGKKPSQIRKRVCLHFWSICICGILTVFAFKTFYKISASRGWLGEKARTKYEQQTRGGEGILALLLGGRMASFCGLTACVDHPLIGFGPWAIDTGKYTSRFLEKYGSPEDYTALENQYRMNPEKIHLIPCHAYLTEFWCWYGIMGLLFWLYVGFVLIRYLKQDCYAVPQWFMWIAASVPAYFWDICFNPFSARVDSIMFIVAVLMTRSVRKGIQPLPYKMILEIHKCEAK